MGYGFVYLDLELVISEPLILTTFSRAELLSLQIKLIFSVSGPMVASLRTLMYHRSCASDDNAHVRISIAHDQELAKTDRNVHGQL